MPGFNQQLVGGGASADPTAQETLTRRTIVGEGHLLDWDDQNGNTDTIHDGRLSSDNEQTAERLTNGSILVKPALQRVFHGQVADGTIISSGDSTLKFTPIKDPYGGWNVASGTYTPQPPFTAENGYSFLVVLDFLATQFDNGEIAGLKTRHSRSNVNKSIIAWPTEKNRAFALNYSFVHPVDRELGVILINASGTDQIFLRGGVVGNDINDWQMHIFQFRG